MVVLDAGEEGLEVVSEDAVERGLLGGATAPGRLRRRHMM